MAQRLAAVAVVLGPHTEACRVRLEKALADERASAGPVGTGVGPIVEPATESQEPAPVAQQEPASSSSGLAAPMPTHPSERADGFTDGVTRTQRAQRSAAKRDANKWKLWKTSGKGKASVTTNDRADGGRFGNRLSSLLLYRPARTR